MLYRVEMRRSSYLVSVPFEQTLQLWQAEPARTMAGPPVETANEGTHTIFEYGSYNWRTDFPPALDGSGAASSSTASFLRALEGCAVNLIRDLLAPQLQMQLETITAIARCENNFRGSIGLESMAPDFLNLQLMITIKSREPKAKIEELYQLWLKRCPVYLGIIKGLAVKTSFEIERPLN